MRKINWFLLIVITLLGLALRVYGINQYPVHLGHGEISQLYDAISIGQTGKDIYGHRLPFIFDSVNDFKPPFYTYMTVIWYWLLGWQEITIKMTGLIFGVLLVPAVFVFSYELFKSYELAKKTSVALLSAFITAISPFEIFFSRKSFENQAGIVFILIGFTLLLRFSRKVSQKRWAVIGMVLLGFGMYTYFSHAILIPLLILGFLLFNRELPAKIPRTAWIMLAIVAIPLYWNIFINQKTTNRSGAVFITQDRLLGEKMDFAASRLGKGFALFNYTAQRYLDQFRPDYIFGFGLDLTKQGYPDVGLLYPIQLPFVLFGLYTQPLFLFFIFLAGLLPSGLTFEDFSPHRSLIAFTVLNIISAVGLVEVLARVNEKGRLLVLTGVTIPLIYSFAQFVYVYKFNYPAERSFDLHYPFKQVALLAWAKRDLYDQIIFDPKFGEDAPKIGTAAHYYFGFYGHYPPSEMQTSFRYGLRDREVLFDKFSLRAIDWRQDSQLRKVLLIASPWSLPPIEDVEKTGKVVFEVPFYNGKIAFYGIEL